MNKMQLFTHEQFGSVRIIEEDGKVLFCGSDVAKALGYANPNKAINDHCRAITKRSTPVSGKIQEINYIPEGDVYRLIAHSKLPSAEKFESWVFDEVLPTIRKTGGEEESKRERVRMNEIGICNNMTIDSREVAEWVEKNHKDLMRDIRGYVEYMEGERKIAPTDFFIESTYVSEQNKVLPCYLLTRKGCEMVANKMTGQKGIIFTAKYIDRFHEYEDRLKAQELQVNQKALLLLKVYDGGLQAVEAAKAIVETETAPLKLELEAAKPKVSYYDSILSAPNAVSVTTIAKDYGMSAKALNEFLHQLGIQYKRGGTWMLYQKYADKGYTRTETVYLPQSNRAQINMKWTQKGRMFIYEQMKKVGMLPVCEKEVA